MKLTPFGLCVRKLRLEANCRLKDMADELGCSSAYLSAIEVGKRPVTEETTIKTIKFFENRGIYAAKEITKSADQSRNTLSMDTLLGDERGVLAAFARRMPESDHAKRSEMLRRLQDILNED